MPLQVPILLFYLPFTPHPSRGTESRKTGRRQSDCFLLAIENLLFIFTY